MRTRSASRRVPRAVRVAALGLFGTLLAGFPACAQGKRGEEPGGDSAAALPEEEFASARREMVELHLSREIVDERVLDAMRKVPRHRFVPPSLRGHAYENRPLPIGEGQTISQPYVVALMTQLLELGPESRVLEVGTGSGYQAAVLAELAGEVYSIEILPEVAKRGAGNLRSTGYDHVHLRVGDGYLGWPEAAPFDGIIVTCAPEHIPEPLQEQLTEGGHLVIPVGERGRQELVLVEKEGGVLVRRAVIPVRFVPMTGIAQDPARADREGRSPGTDAEVVEN